MHFPRSKAADSAGEAAKYLQLLTRCKQHFYLQQVKKTTFTNHKMVCNEKAMST